MSIDSTWLRCPNCSADLEVIDAGTIGCSSGHRFDVAKSGQVTLLPPRAPRTLGDTRPMLEARQRLLDSGLFRPIADSIARTTRSVDDATHQRRIVDLGCGSGYYAAHLAQAVGSASFLLTDRSPIAVRMATRLVPRSTGVVLDLWRPLPIRDDAADIAINVFAPRNPDEFARIIRPGGSLIVVVPTAAHLRELRTAGSMLEVPEGKDAHVTTRLTSAGFRPIAAERVEYEAAIDAPQRGALRGMGPSAHHVLDPGALEESPFETDAATPERVTVSVDVLAFRRETARQSGA